jgi:hypothetical protein
LLEKLSATLRRQSAPEDGSNAEPAKHAEPVEVSASLIK